MAWRRATFKGKDVWVEVGPGGQPLVAGGRVPMRYSDQPGATVYRASPGNLQLADAPPVDLEAGVSADDRKKTGGSASGGRGRGFGKAGTRTKAQKAMAAEAAKELLAALPEGTAVIWTDGACQGNPGPAGSGVAIELPDGRRLEASRSLGRATNNIAELTAIELALDLLDQLEWPADARAALLTDSDYSHGVVVRGWKAKANRELILGLRERVGRRPGLAIHWVAGHVGTEGNERADALAGAGAGGITGQRWVEPGGG